jgi:DtxR family transcriptional regulator, Mn-dependent transcriptional regulator
MKLYIVALTKQKNPWETNRSIVIQLWKKFDTVELSHSSIHHLLAIHNLVKKNGYVRAIDIAKYLEITRGSVSKTLHKIKKKGFIVDDDNKFYQLSKKGKELVNSVLSKRRIAENFFTNILQLPEEIAEADGCKIEHLLSQETGEKLFSFIGYFLSDTPEAKAFRKGYKNFSVKCKTFTDCKICEVECFFAGETNN